MRSRSISSEEEEESSSNQTPTSNHDVANAAGLFSRYHQYSKLPQPLVLKLSVLKLDASLFDVFVSKNSTVAELKQAVEEVFASTAKEISWWHVWGHFCLCYNGDKLINDKACLRNFWIKDGDQLQFIRHMSIQYSPLRKRPNNKSVTCKQHSMLSSGSDAHEEKEGTSSDDNNENQDNSKHYSGENQEQVPLLEFKLAKFLRGWLSNSRSWGLSRKGEEGGSAGTGFALHCLRGGPRDDDLSLMPTINGCKN